MLGVSGASNASSTYANEQNCAAQRLKQPARFSASGLTEMLGIMFLCATPGFPVAVVAYLLDSDQCNKTKCCRNQCGCLVSGEE